jgi:uncharacterized protein
MPSTPLLPWRQTVRAAAQEAAVVDDRERWGDARTSFAYRWEHVQAVARLAVRLAERTGADPQVCEVAAWLHDVAKPHSTDHGRDGAAIARRILTGTNFPPDKVDRVADAIAKHVGLTLDAPVEPLEAAVLWDADKLTKLGATIVLHGLGYLLAEGKSTTEALIVELGVEDWGAEIVESLNTAPARAAGRTRLETYRAFCRSILREWEGDDLPE